MHVLHAAETVQGGVAGVLNELLSDRGGIQPHVVAPIEQLKFLSHLDRTSTFAYRRSGRDIASLLRFSVALARATLKIRPEIVHLHSTFAGALGRSVLLLLRPWVRPKVVYCPHGFSFLVTTRAWWRALAAPLEVLLSRVTDAIICVSDFELTRARQHGIPASRLARIYNGISATDIATPNPFDSSKFNLLFVGRFDRQKGFDVLLDAWTRAARSDARLTVIGDWVIDRASSPELPAGVQAIEWRTPAQLRAYYQHADAIIVPSRWEGFALVPLEAMRDGLCVVASDACSLPEAVQHGSTGFIFETGDAAALAKVLASITAEDCRRLGLHGQQVFQARFTADRMRRLVRSLYQDLARANRA